MLDVRCISDKLQTSHVNCKCYIRSFLHVTSYYVCIYMSEERDNITAQTIEFLVFDHLKSNL